MIGIINFKDGVPSYLVLVADPSPLVIAGDPSPLVISGDPSPSLILAEDPSLRLAGDLLSDLFLPGDLVPYIFLCPPNGLPLSA